jgi:hypothetical protein
MNPVQSQGFDAIKTHKYNLIFGEKYCIEEGALLYVDGGLKRFRRLRPSTDPGFHPFEHEILSWDGSRSVVAKTSHFLNETSRQALRLQFNNGNHITVSPWHPLWCAYRKEDGTAFTGFVKAEDIAGIVSNGRQVYVPLLRYPQFVTSRYLKVEGVCLDEGTGYLLGALCGDGTLSGAAKGGMLQFTNADAECVDRVRHELAAIGCELRAGKRKYSFSICNAADLKALLCQLGMATLSKFKRIPDQIIESPAPVIRSFLRGLFDTDGTVDKKVGCVAHATASEGLSKDVQDCLQALGIFSVRRFSPNKKAGCWKTYCMGEEGRKFIDQIGFEIKRKSDHGVSSVAFVNRKAYGYPEFIRDAMKALKPGTACLGVRPNHRKPFKVKKIVSTRRFKGTVTWNVSGHIRGEDFCRTFGSRGEAKQFALEMQARRSKVRGHTRAWHNKRKSFLHCGNVPSPGTLNRFKQICGTSESLDALTFTDRWVLVESASPTEATLCDLTVPKTDSFIANGIVNHNSAKSYLGLLALVDHCRENRNARGLIIVPTGRQAEEGGVWHKLNTDIRDDYERNGNALFTEPRSNRYKDIYIWISNKFGGWSRVILVSMPYEGFVAPRVKGIEPSFILVDEAQVLESDTYFKHLVQQLGRDRHIAHKAVVYTCNPAGPSHWLYNRFFVMPVDEKTGKWNDSYYVLHLPIADNKHNLPEGYLETVMDCCKGDDTEYRRMILGEWVEAPVGDGLFRNDYNENLHVKGDAIHNVGLLPIPGIPIDTGWDLGAAHSSVTFEQFIPVKDRLIWLVFDECVFIDRYIAYPKLVPIVMERVAYWRARQAHEFRVNYISDDSAFNQYRAATGSFDVKDIEDLSKGVIKMVAAPKGAYSVETRVRLCREGLTNVDLQVSATCLKTREMFRKLEEDPNNRLRPRAKSRFGHAFDSLTYARIYYAARGRGTVRPQIGEVAIPRVYTAG